MEPTASRRRFTAVIFLVLSTALTMSVLLNTETLVAVTLPTIRLLSALRRAEESPANTVAVPFISRLPVCANR